MENMNDEEFEMYYRTLQIQQQQQEQSILHTAAATTDFNHENLLFVGSFSSNEEYYNTNSIPSTTINTNYQFTHNTNTTRSETYLRQQPHHQNVNDTSSLVLDPLMPSTIHFNDHSSDLITTAAFAATPVIIATESENQQNISIYNTAAPIDNNSHFLFSQQQHVILNDGNVMFEHFPMSTHSNFQEPQRQTIRQEQDVFNELISLATKSSGLQQQQQQQQQSDMSSWPHVTNNVIAQYNQQHQYHNFGPEPPLPPSSSTGFQRHMDQGNYFHPPDPAPLINTTTTSVDHPPCYTSQQQIIQQDNSYNTHEDRNYKLIIVQQPSRARMCGFGDKDRRPISPPPILQLVVTTKYGQLIHPDTFDASFLVVMCDSCQKEEEEQVNLPQDDTIINYSQEVSFPIIITTNEQGFETNTTAIKMRNLVGFSVSSATKLYDLNGHLGIFFIFQDVSLRTEGCFRLKFSLVDIGSPYSRHVNTTGVSSVLKTIYTDPFIVYTAKKFPGVVQSTPLSKWFAKQGIKIPIRKEKIIMSSTVKKRQAIVTAGHSDEEEEEEEEEDEV